MILSEVDAKACAEGDEHRRQEADRLKLVAGAEKYIYKPNMLQGNRLPLTA